MHGTDARLDSQERNLISYGPIRWLTRLLRSAWSFAVAAAIFALALVVLQVGLTALGLGFVMFTRISARRSDFRVPLSYAKHTMQIGYDA